MAIRFDNFPQAFTSYENALAKAAAVSGLDFEVLPTTINVKFNNVVVANTDDLDQLHIILDAFTLAVNTV